MFVQIHLLEAKLFVRTTVRFLSLVHQKYQVTLEDF